MNRSLRSLMCPAALAVTMAALAAVPAAQAAAAPPGRYAPPGSGYQVTLITGDKVRVEDPASAHPGIVFTPGPGRAGIPFHVSAARTAGGHEDISVVPADQAGLIEAGRLSPQLFDVSLLARDGDYHPARAAAPRAARAAAGARTYQVFVRLLDRSGVPLPPPGARLSKPYSVLGTVVSTATGMAPPAIRYDIAAGAYVMRLPAGGYYMDGLVSTPAYRAAVIQPDVQIQGSTTVTLDARSAVPVITKVSRPGAATLLDYAEIDQTIDGAAISSAYGTVYSPGDHAPFYLTPTSTVTGRPFLYSLHTSLTTPGAFPTARHLIPASYEYNLLFTHHGSVPASLDYQVSDSQLATVQTRYYTQRATLPKPDSAQQASLPAGPGNELLLSFDSPVIIPPAGQATLYYNDPPGVQWFTNSFINDVSADPGDIAPLATYSPGRTYERSFDAAALSPAGMAVRSGNLIYIYPAPFSPSEPGHYMPALSGLSDDGSAVRSTLSLNGTVIGRTDSPVGAGFPARVDSGRYAITELATRPASTWSLLGTRSTATWSFFSRNLPGAVALPLLTVRASGPFDSSDAARAGKPVPLSLQVQEIPNGATLTSLTLSASFDGGKTWQRVHLYRAGNRWLALVPSPPGHGYVSLRTSATDSAGDTAIAATINSYAVTPAT